MSLAGAEMFFGLLVLMFTGGWVLGYYAGKEAERVRALDAYFAEVNRVHSENHKRLVAIMHEVNKSIES